MSWCSKIFTDPKLAWDRAKFLMTQGPLSLKTGLEEANYDPAVEAENKKDEAKKNRKDELLPIFDQSHGNRPADMDPAGRPPGSRNGDGA